MLDYILLNIAGTGDVNYAFIPLLLTAGQAALSIGKGVSAAKAAKEAAERAGERASEDAAEAAKRMKEIEAGNLRFDPEKLTMSNKMTEAFDTKMSRAAEDVAAESREQALASANLQGGNIAGAVDLFGDQARKDAIAGLTGRADAMTTLGREESRIDDANIRAFNVQAAKEFSQADQMARAAELGVRAAEDAELEADRQKRQAIVQGIGSGIMGVLGTGAATGLFGDTQQELMQDYQDYQEGDILGEDSGTENEIVVPPLDGEAEHGRKYKFRDGGDVMVTDGEFSHKTNKKAIIDEETGIKEGEMTGQEALVFNDEHVAIIEELTNRGDEEMLMMFMRELLSQPQFQDEA
tara:strand:+ start:6942 stop:7997 length:1056 start_codon:yes stop_codon:yes gene_type:complete